MHLGEKVKYGFDAASAALAVVTLAQLLPAVAALLSIVWTGIRIYETRTVQTFLRRRGLLDDEA